MHNDFYIKLVVTKYKVRQGMGSVEKKFYFILILLPNNVRNQLPVPWRAKVQAQNAPQVTTTAAMPIMMILKINFIC